MGFNSTIVVLNDALDYIKEDPHFGKTLYEAILEQHLRGDYVDIHAGSFCNAATVIEQHHADFLVGVVVGGNTGSNLGYIGPYSLDPQTEDGKRAILKGIASKFGLEIAIRKKQERR